MTVKRTSAETAASFLARRQRHGHRRSVVRKSRNRLDDRIVLDMARGTVEECLDCVSARINEAHRQGNEPDHITNIAWQMLCEALIKPTR